MTVSPIAPDIRADVAPTGLSAADPACAPTAEAQTMGAPAAGHLASVLKSLADPLRLRMLSLIATTPGGEACVCDIATVAEVSQPTVSHHLKVLKDSGLLTSERRGTWVYYRIAPGFRGAVATLLDGFGPAAMAAMAASTPSPGTEDLSDVDATLTRIAAELAGEFPDLAPATVLQVVRESYTALARTAGVRGHLVATAERFARQRLADLSRNAARPRPAPPQVLFVCVANAGRSQIAAALVRHYAAGDVVVRSAGSAPAGEIHAPVSDLLAEIVGGSADDAFPKPLTDDALRASDVVVTMGCGDTCPLLPGTRYEDWVVGDPALASPVGVRAIAREIDRRVRALVAELLPGRALLASPFDASAADRP